VKESQRVMEQSSSERTSPPHSITHIRNTNRPAITVKEWIAQIETVTMQVTGVSLNRTDTGLEIVLQTAEGKPLQIDATQFYSEGNSLLAEIPNAVLALPEGQAFVAETPTADIAIVQVVQQDVSTIQVRVTGTEMLPETEVTLKTGEFAYSLNPEPDEPDEEIVVTGEGQRGYRVPNASAATRTDTPLRDVPQSIQVIPRQVLEDQQAIRLDEVVRNASGVVESGQGGGTRDRYLIRGFDPFVILRNGFRDGDRSLLETANIERVEVLKGPASVLYGNLEPGGIINLVTKQPLEDPFYLIDFQGGSDSLFRPSIDFSGPLDVNKTVLYRLNTVYETANSFRDFDQNIERFFIAPVLTWKIGNQTDLSIDLDYLTDERPFDRGLVAIGNRVADLPRKRILGEPDDIAKVEQFGVGYRLEHRFSENLTLRNAFRYLWTHTFDFRAEAENFNERTGVLNRRFRSNDDISKIYSLQTDLVSKFTTGSISHTMLFGVDLIRQTSEGDQRAARPGFTPSINVFNPIYNLVPTPERSSFPLLRDSESTIDTLGIFLQDQITLAENLKLLIGGRFDIVDQERVNRLANVVTTQYDDAFTPRLGVVYQPIQPISLYASYSRSFRPNSRTRADGSFLEPERGTQYEVGLKADLNSRLSATLSAYQINKSNIATTDLANTSFALPVGEQRSRGIELDLAGAILPGWNIIATYAHIDAKVTEDNSLTVGNRLANVPLNTASLWTTYEIQQGGLQGLGFGIGLFFVGDRQGDIQNTYTLPSYLRTDATIFYRKNRFRAAISIKYFEAVDFGREAVRVGAPLTILGRVSVEF
jgi:iron complex outermembrane recepter protein